MTGLLFGGSSARVLSAGLLSGASFAFLALGCPIALSAAIPTSASAQTVTCGTTTNGGTVVTDANGIGVGNCGPMELHNFTQDMNSTVTATVTISGQTVTITPTPTDGSPATVTATDLSSISLAMGNNLTASIQGPLGIIGSATQNVRADVTATNVAITTAAVPGASVLTTNAYGNTAQAQACCGGLDVTFNQQALLGRVVSITDLFTAPGIGTLNVSGSATANVIGGSSSNGPTLLESNQLNRMEVTANVRTVLCCNVTSTSSGVTAAANSAATSSTNATNEHNVVQDNYGAVTANGYYYTLDGNNMIAAAQATANSANAANTLGYTQLTATQHNGGAVRAESYGHANIFTGTFANGSTAQANSAMLSTSGSDGVLVIDQLTDLTGGVTALTTFEGASLNGVGTATATAAGNSVTGFACSGCGSPEVKLEANGTQVNNANIMSTVSMTAGLSGTLAAQATAIGNTANFIAQTGNLSGNK